MSKSGNITTTVNGGTPLDFNVGLTGNPAMPISLDAGLSDIGIALLGDPSKPVALELGLTAIGDPNKPIALDLGLTAVGDPTKPIAVDLGLAVTINKLELQLDPLDIKLEPVKLDLGLDNINVCLSLAFTEFPRMQVHMPKKYDFGFSLFGIPIVGFNICGETSIMTEDNPTQVFHTPGPAPKDFAKATTNIAKNEEPYRVVLS